MFNVWEFFSTSSSFFCLVVGFFFIFISWSYFDLAHVMFISAITLNTRASASERLHTFRIHILMALSPKKSYTFAAHNFLFSSFFAVAAIRAQIIGNDSFILIFRGPLEMLIIFQLLMNWLVKKRCDYLSICITFGGFKSSDRLLVLSRQIFRLISIIKKGKTIILSEAISILIASSNAIHLH